MKQTNKAHSVDILNSLNCTFLRKEKGKPFWVKPINEFSYFVLRFQSKDEKVIHSLKSLNISVPHKLTLTKQEDNIRHLMLWISFDEYLFIIPNAEKKLFQEKVQTTLQTEGLNYVLVDVSGTYSYCQLGGEKLYPVLSQCVYYDFENNFNQSKVISSLLAKAPSIFFRIDNTSIHWLCRNSFAVYAYRFLEKASLSFLESQK